MIISLLGYMGSGKSHVAKILKDQLAMPLLDLDAEIVLRMGMTIPSIFQRKGELAFRKTEKQILDEILVKKENLILSLGGGTPVYYDNMDQILQYSTSFFLRTKIPTLVSRLMRQKSRRPILAKLADEEVPEFVAKHLFERNDYYNRALHIVDTDDKTPVQVAKEIISILDLRR